MTQSKILEVKDLKQDFDIGKGHVLSAVDGISFQLYQGEILGIVGESGSGKSTLGKSILQMYKPTAGQVYYKGLELTNQKVYKANKQSLCNDLQLVFQDSSSALNPRMTVQQIIGEPLLLQKKVRNKVELLKKIKHLLTLVELEEQLLKRHPYECSGGQRQRIAIARAISVQPKVLIADEPIASLDIALQVQIIDLLVRLKREQQLSCILISHDLRMIMHVCDRIAVMRQGKIVEIGESSQIRRKPQHEYTKTLLEAMLV